MNIILRIVAIFALLLALPTIADAQDASGTEKIRVAIGAYFNDIQGPDWLTNSYTVDLFLWMRWRHPELDPTATMDFINRFQGWDHELIDLYDGPQDLPDGSQYMAFRYRGQFRGELLMHSYPFDRHELVIEIEDKERAANELEYVADTYPVAINRAVTLPGFTLGEPRMRIEPHQYETRLGDPRIARSVAYSRVSISIPVRRVSGPETLKILVPILLVTVCAAFVFLIHPGNVDGRLGTAITALLTLVVLQMSTKSLIPKVDYLILVDVIQILAYLFITFTLWHAVRTSRLQDRPVRSLVRLDRSMLTLSGAIFAVSAGLTIIFYLV